MRLWPIKLPAAATLWVSAALACSGARTPEPNPSATRPTVFAKLAAKPTPTHSRASELTTPERTPTQDVDTCGCPKHPTPAGSLLWRKKILLPWLGCFSSFSKHNEIELDCYTQGQARSERMAFDAFGKSVPERAAPTDSIPFLERAWVDAKTWGKVGIDTLARPAYVGLPDRGGIVWAATKDDPDQALLVRLNADGRRLWSRAMVGGVVDIATDAEGSVVLVGMASDRCEYPGQPGAYTLQGIVTRLSPTGDLLWSARLPCATTVRSVRLTPPNELAVMGSFMPASDNDTEWNRSYVAVYSRAGEALYTQSDEALLHRACSCTFRLTVSEGDGRGPVVELDALP